MNDIYNEEMKIMKYETTAKRIREAMSDMGISQQELANKTGIGKSSISHYVNGSNEPGNKSAFLLAQVLNVNPAWLMGLEVSKEPVEFEIEAQGGTGKSDAISRALKLYGLYENATPEARQLVENFLKSSQDKK